MHVMFACLHTRCLAMLRKARARSTHIALHAALIQLPGECCAQMRTWQIHAMLQWCVHMHAVCVLCTILRAGSPAAALSELLVLVRARSGLLPELVGALDTLTPPLMR